MKAKKKKDKSVFNENWQPDDIDGEEKASCNKLVEEMLMIIKMSKNGKDVAKIKDMMNPTNSFRRSFINSKPALADIVANPVLSMKDDLWEDFEHLTSRARAMKTAQVNFRFVSSHLMMLTKKAVKGKVKAAMKFKELFSQMDAANGEANEALRQQNG